MNNPIIHTQMLQHGDVWRGIDRLAAKHGLSASGLARRAGLDPTAFNPSKRITVKAGRVGRARESVAKILAVTGESFSSFVQLTGAAGSGTSATTMRSAPAAWRPARRHAPCRSSRWSVLSEGECFSNDGQPKGEGWGRMSFGTINDRGAFAIEISGRDLDPIYRDGDVVVVSPTAEIRRGDRVVVQSGDGSVQHPPRRPPGRRRRAAGAGGRLPVPASTSPAAQTRAGSPASSGPASKTDLPGSSAVRRIAAALSGAAAFATRAVWGPRLTTPRGPATVDGARPSRTETGRVRVEPSTR